MPRFKQTLNSARIRAGTAPRAPFDSTEIGENRLPLALMHPSERAVLDA